MNRVLLVTVMLLMGSMAFAADECCTWSEMKANGALKVGEVVKRHGVEMLKLSNTTAGESTFNIFTEDLRSGVRRDMQLSYAISGEVEYEDVQGHAYLEMLSYFPPPKVGPFFSRTLSPSGLTGWLTGTGRRQFEVPFFLTENEPKPIRLEFSVVLPGRGTVYLGQVRFVQGSLRSPHDENVRMGQMGGILGGIFGGFGALAGILGGIIGVLAGKGKARTFVLGTVKAIIGTGILMLIAGLVLVVIGQWWILYVPFFFMGLLLLAVMAPLLPLMRQRYDELELRRITAQDAGG